MQRSPRNPILTRADVPVLENGVRDVSSVFNPGATRFRDRFLLLLRVQSRARETFLVKAESDDGERFEVSSRPVRFEGLERDPRRFHHVYDPRITRLEGRYHVVFAADTDTGCVLGTARTDDFEHFELLEIGARDSRNGVLFPERIGGRYLRLERPNDLDLPGGPRSGETIVLSESEDLRTWKVVAPVLAGRPRYWDERIGSGPPPIRTQEGWLHVYHGVATHFQSANLYQAGVVLLDLDDPSVVRARSWQNVLEPRTRYEQGGQVPNVVFPSGMVVEGLDEGGCATSASKVWLYYGAADECIGLATATVGGLLAACRE